MSTIARSLFVVAVAALLVLHFDAHAQEAASSKPSQAYTPGLGEFMLATQTRHAKLWWAGRAGNWDLADYEIDELKEGLEDIVKYIPVFKDIPVGKMIESIMDAPIENVEKAIKAKDRARFVVAFDKLTEACNTCHHSANRGFIAIRRPTSPTFSNQSFSPSRK
jgi:hypothetical protein